jgi:Tol biopolymer transport system component
MIPRATLVAMAAVVLAAGSAAGQAPPPGGDWLTFRTEHFRVTFTPGLEGLARKAAGSAERAYGVLSRELDGAPSGTIDLVVTDHVDYTNGYATPFESNRIVVFARPPTAIPQLAYARDWLELVVVHELVHIFHLDRSGALGRLVRSVFGRVPMSWPIFPVVGAPNWNVEGLAVHYESRLTGAGRIGSSVHDMIIRTAAIEDRIPALDELSAPSPVWPAGQREYVFGSRVMHYIADEYGPEALAAIVAATAGSVPPTFFFSDHIARVAVGRPFDDLYDEWRKTARDSARAVQRRVEAAGRTETETIVGRGPYVAAPRVSPDGHLVSFGAHDFRSDPATRLVDPETGRVRSLARRNQSGALLGPASWMPDGRALVAAQLELQGPYRVYSDLWRIDLDGRERRLTRGLRLAQPDVSGDGRRVAAVQNDDGAIRLVVYDLETGASRVLADAAPGEAFDSPRWAPDGRRIAVSRFAGGTVDLVLVDVGTGTITPVTHDPALDLSPAWSPDGRWLLWWSDRTGIPNLMAVSAEAVSAEGRSRGPGRVLQVTNVATGAFDPEVAPDGRSLFFAGYHHDGWHLERMPFDPPSWGAAPDGVMAFGHGMLPEPGRSGSRSPSPAPDSGGPASSYSALPTVRPYYWVPTYASTGGTGGLQLVGAHTAGADVLRRHRWQVGAAVDVHTGRLAADGAWTYRGWGTPELSAAARRDWESAGGSIERADGTLEPLLARTDEAAVSTTFLRPRWRSTAWLRATADVEARRYEARDLSTEDLAELGVTLAEVPTISGIQLVPGWSNARRHPFSISREDGIVASVGAGRWWVLEDGSHAYDELTGRLSGYLGVPVWGFANHVLASRVSGFVRDGDRARLRSIGGPLASSANLLLVVAGGRSDYGVRGFSEGARTGTRGWTVNAEYRFPIHMRNAPGNVLGLSLTSISGALFADAGDAWCTPSDLDRLGAELCTGRDAGPLVSTGAELVIDFGAFSQLLIRLRVGAAAPLDGPSGGDPLYVSLGSAF